MHTDRVATGVRSLDAALAGGVAPGAALLLAGEEGAGATEFALAFVRHAVTDGKARARILSALRSPARVLAEYEQLFDGTGAPKAVEIRAVNGEKLRADPVTALVGLARGDVLVIESADALVDSDDGFTLTPTWRVIADAAGDRGVVVLLLLSPGTLPPAVEASLGEAADGVLHFGWQASALARRRVLMLVKMRGLGPGVDGGEVPLFEISLQRGTGFSVSRGRSVL